MINHYSNTCIVPPLIDFLLGYVTLIHYDVVSQELHHVVGTDGTSQGGNDGDLPPPLSPSVNEFFT